MSSAQASVAGRALSGARWGDVRIKSLIAELEQRRAELSAEHLRELRELVDETERT